MIMNLTKTTESINASNTSSTSKIKPKNKVFFRNLILITISQLKTTQSLMAKATEAVRLTRLNKVNFYHFLSFKSSNKQTKL